MKSPSNVAIGDTIKAGTLVVMTCGEYSGYGIAGIYKADTDVVVPGIKRTLYFHPWEKMEVDTATLSTLLIELDYVEAWG